MFKYAQVDLKTGIIEGINYLLNSEMEIENPNLIPIDDDFIPKNKRWNGSEWEHYEEEREELPKRPLSDIELSLLNTELNTEYLVCLADLGL